MNSELIAAESHRTATKAIELGRSDASFLFRTKRTILLMFLSLRFDLNGHPHLNKKDSHLDPVAVLRWLTTFHPLFHIKQYFFLTK